MRQIGDVAESLVEPENVWDYGIRRWFSHEISTRAAAEFVAAAAVGGAFKRFESKVSFAKAVADGCLGLARFRHGL